MTMPDMHWTHFKRHWRAILLAALALVAIGAVSALTAWQPSVSDELSVRAIMPDRLARTHSSQLPVVVTHRDLPAQGATVRLLGSMAGGSHGSARALGAGEQGLFIELHRAATDAQGVATLTLPAREQMTAQQARWLSEQPELVLEVTHGGEVSYQHHSLSHHDDAIMTMMLDRPLYQPGQLIKMRAIMVEGASGAPLANQQATWKIHDPKRNLVFKERARSSTAGVIHTEFALSPQALQGAYSITLESSGLSSINQAVDVRPFRLPRYKVEVSTFEESVRLGESAVVEVVATYMHGERVAGAQAQLTVLAPQATGRVSKRVMQATTNAQGIASFEISSANQRAGDAITLMARVDIAGRSEQGQTQLRVLGQHLQNLDILAAHRARFIASTPQKGYVIVRDQAGAPMADVEVALTLPEREDARIQTVRTDAQGRAAFTWTPAHNVSSLRVRARARGRSWETLNVPVEVSYEAAPRIVSALASGRVGEPMRITLAGMNTPGVLALRRRGMIVASAPVLKQSTSQVITLTPPPSARGACEVVLLTGGSTHDAERVSVWIGQRGSEEVQVSVPGEDHRPGQSAAVSLSFPPGDEPGERPVTFGLVGVDEALYALKERSELPLWLVLRQDPRQLQAAIEALRDAELSDPIAGELAAARFQRASASQRQAQPLSQPHSLDERVLRLRKARWQRAFSALCLVLMLLCAVSVALTSVRRISREVFSWRRAAAMLLVTLGAALFLGVTAQVTRGEDGVMGALMLWLVVVVGLFVEASLRMPQTGLPRFFAGLGFMGAFFGSAMLCQEAALGATPAWWELMAWICLIPTGLMLAFAVIVWPFILMHHGLRQAGLALVTLCAPLPLSFLALTGARYEMTPERLARSTNRYSAQSLIEREEAEPLTRKPSSTPAAPPDAPRVRSYFPETMVWLPELPGDARGQATASLELPDSITTWRLDAWAHTQDGRFGQGRAALRVWQPFFVELELPTHLTQGDRLQVPVSLVNHHERAVQVSLDAMAEGALMLSGLPTGTLTLQASERRVITLTLLAQRSGAGALTVSARVDGALAGDAVKRSVLVTPDGPLVRRSDSHLLKQAWTHTVQIPADAIPGTSFLDVNVLPGPMADALEGLESMLRQPSGCFEQTSSANYPNALILRALRATKPAQWPAGEDAWHKTHARATTFAQLGYQRILTFQRPGGGFALYPNQEPDILLTAYGIMQLEEMKDLITVDEQVLQRAESWLLAQQNTSGSWPLYAARIAGGSWQGSREDVGQVRATSFVVLALASRQTSSARRAVAKALTHMTPHLPAVTDLDTLALAASALATLGKSEQAGALLERLAGQVQRDELGAHFDAKHPTWMGGTSHYADIETTALALFAILESQQHGELAADLARYLTLMRSPYGGWGSTQATVWALRAMQKLKPPTAEPITVAVQLDAESMRHANGRGEPGQVVVSPTSLLASSFTGELSQGTHLLGLTPRAETSATVQAITRFAVPWSSELALSADAPFALTVKAPEVLPHGRPARVEVLVKNASSAPRAASIVELPALPGAAIERDDFEAMVAAGEIDSFEILPDRIRVYISGFEPNQQRRFVYELTPLLRGEFSLTPAMAWRFYTPSPRASANAGDVSVR